MTQIGSADILLVEDKRCNVELSPVYCSDVTAQPTPNLTLRWEE
jgi:hypothetical protein